jgi:hypothetical protein
MPPAKPEDIEALKAAILRSTYKYLTLPAVREQLHFSQMHTAVCVRDSGGTLKRGTHGPGGRTSIYLADHPPVKPPEERRWLWK